MQSRQPVYAHVRGGAAGRRTWVVVLVAAAAVLFGVAVPPLDAHATAGHPGAATAHGASGHGGGMMLGSYRPSYRRVSGPDIHTPVLPSARPRVTGSDRAGRVLRGHAAQHLGSTVSVSFRWLRDRHSIAHATHPTYAVRPVDRGHRLALRVTYSVAGGAATELVSRGIVIRR